VNVNQVLSLVPRGADRSKALEHSLSETTASFGETLTKAIADVNSLQAEAGKAAESMVRGESVDLHDVMVAVEKAKTSFELLMEVRNKTISAYQELMRMQV